MGNAQSQHPEQISINNNLAPLTQLSLNGSADITINSISGNDCKITSPEPFNCTVVNGVMLLVTSLKKDKNSSGKLYSKMWNIKSVMKFDTLSIKSTAQVFLDPLTVSENASVILIKGKTVSGSVFLRGKNFNTLTIAHHSSAKLELRDVTVATCYTIVIYGDGEVNGGQAIRKLETTIKGNGFVECFTTQDCVVKSCVMDGALYLKKLPKLEEKEEGKERAITQH